MHALPHTLRRVIAVLIAGLLLASGLVLSSQQAHAAVTVTDPVSGASITLSKNRIAPGERIEISGRGFTPVQGSSGEPLVAVRPYDFDNGPAWTTGGRDSYRPADPSQPPGSEAKYWFVTHHDQDGSFEGWLEAPASLTSAGPLGNGQHWLRILSGAFFTTTGDRITSPITFQVPFSVASTSASINTGLTSPTGVFQPGTTFRPGAQLTVRGDGFTPGSEVAATLDGKALTSSITADSEGSLPSQARVTLPDDVSIGSHTLRLATGSRAAQVSLRITAAPTATLLTDRVRPGGTIRFALTGYIGVGGAPQKIAVVVNEKVLACIHAGSNGAANGTAQLPADLTGTVVVGFNVGLSCVLPPIGVINDQPISRITQTVTVDAEALPRPSALTVTAPASVRYGAARTTTVTLTIDGVPAAGQVKVTQGKWTKTVSVGTKGSKVTLPIDAPVGSQKVTADFAGDDHTAAATASRSFKVTKASSSASLRLSASKVTRTKQVSATVKIGIGGAPNLAANGTIRIYDGSKRLGTYTLKTVHRGTLKVKLPKITKKGTHKLKAVYAGNSNVTGKTSKTVTLKVI